MLCAVIVFLNIALAVIYQRYTEDREDDIVEQNAKRHISLALAYQTIDADMSKTIDKVCSEVQLCYIYCTLYQRTFRLNSWHLLHLHWHCQKEFIKFMTKFRELKLRQMPDVAIKETQLAEIDLIWKALNPKHVKNDGSSLTHENREEIGPSEFIKLPSIIAAKTRANYLNLRTTHKFRLILT
eukprot:SAG31_NODE_1577_length_7836_cov_3.212744_10_plen_183_part_00